MICQCCGDTLVETLITFDAVRKDTVYVVKNVPALTCERCGRSILAQDVTKRIERFVSGRVIPTRKLSAWAFDWTEPVIEVVREPIKGTEAVRIPLTVVGTAR